MLRLLRRSIILDTSDASAHAHLYLTNQTKVRSILLNTSTFPLISFLEHDGVETLKIMEQAHNFDYVAISHVWSDGLGNLHSNALPQCQLRRLGEFAPPALRHISLKADNGFYWVDTVRCPPEDGDAQDLAISRMRETYERASCVLVLDSWLQLQPISGLSGYEIMTKIACSGWNRRL
jgi:hypothetical protein